MSDYTYLACDLITNAVLAELPLDSVSFSSVLNDTGDLQGSIPLNGSAALDVTDILTATQPARTALYVDRKGVLVWGGIIWTRSYSEQDQALQIGANDFLSYFGRRTLTTDAFTTATDPSDAIIRLGEWCFTPGGSGAPTIAGVMQFAKQASPLTVTPNYRYYERRNILQEMRTLSHGSISADGTAVEFACDVAYHAGVPQVTLGTFWPRRGLGASFSGYVFEFPGNILTYDWPEDGTQFSDTVYGVGAGSQDTTLLSTQSDASLLPPGGSSGLGYYPVIDEVYNDKGIATQAVLDGAAQSRLAAVAVVPTPATVVVRADIDPVLGSYRTGDEARFRITSPRFPAPSTGGAGLDAPYRIVGMEVRPPDDNGPETVTLTLGPVVSPLP